MLQTQETQGGVNWVSPEGPSAVCETPFEGNVRYPTAREILHAQNKETWPCCTSLPGERDSKSKDKLGFSFDYLSTHH